ncbi:MAG: type II secretion system protein GspD [Candidatus Omnitrophica bacterium]|nr:type II secretion system protein GspD [Candidatus Omnitrophota bacterium]
MDHRMNRQNVLVFIKTLIMVCGIALVFGTTTLCVFSQDENPPEPIQTIPPEEQAILQGIDAAEGDMPIPEPPLEDLYQDEEISDIGATHPLSEEEVNQGVKIAEERISLDLKGVDIIELFRILSLKMNLTIVPSRKITGRVNIFLNNITFEDALDVILVSQQLACEKKNEIISVMTAAEYETLYGKKYNEKREIKSINLSYAEPASVFKALSELKSSIGKIIVDEASGTIILIDIPDKIELMEKVTNDLDKPLQTEVFDINYAKTEDLKTHLSEAITTGPGELLIDERSGKVLVSDLPKKMKKIKKIVEALDEENRQVFIEAEIIQISLKDEYHQGIDWERVFQNAYMHGLDLTSAFSPIDAPPNYTTENFAMTVGTLDADDFDATLDMLESYGNTKILSRPRIAVVNNEEAKILVGIRDAYVTQSLSQAETTTVTSESIEFVDVGVKLNVVPTIGKDGFVTMKIKPEVSSVIDELETSLGSRIPIIETSEAETVVKVKDNTMIMIAGLIKDSREDDEKGIPFLRRIPILGAVFGSQAKKNNQTEIVIFLKPHIIKGDVPVKHAEIQDHIPADIMPDDLQESIISKKIEQIRVTPKNLSPLGTCDENKNEPKSSKKPASISDKMKGIKEY